MLALKAAAALLPLLLLAPATACPPANSSSSRSGADPATAFSTRMLNSIVTRQQGLVSSGQATSTLESGLISLAVQAWLDLYATTTTSSSSSSPDTATSFRDYVSAILGDVSATASFTNVSLAARLPLDRMTLAQALEDVPGVLTADEGAALGTLNESLAVQERNQYGGFWYYTYPSWSYLDGAVSFLPYMSAPSSLWSPSDALQQIQLLSTACAHPSGLLVHGYDASRTAVWANNATGGSPYVWGRSLGWYLAGLVNAWEALPSPAPNTTTAALADTIRSQFTSLASVLASYADPTTGAWWQLTTLPGAPGNYLESSSTALFTFSLLKGLRLNLIPDNTTLLRDVALRAYNYTASSGAFVVDYGNGTLGYNRTVTVCSLNSSASYEYYVGRPINPDAPLGAAAFVLASLEVERLG